MTARSDAQALHERKPATALEADLDYCDNVYGVSPCTAGRTAETGTAQAGSATTLTLRAGASAVDDAFNGLYLGLRSGAGSIQTRKVLDYVGSTKVATMDKQWRVNRLSYSAQLDQWGGSAVVVTDQARDAEGKLKLDTLADNDAGNYLSRSRSITVPNDGATYVLEMDVVKDVNATQRAGLNIGLAGGTPVNINPRFALDGTNLAGCTATEIPASGAQPALLRLRFAITNNSSGNTTLNINVYPATSTTKGGGDNVAGVGSMTCGRVHVRASTESEDYIESGSAAVTVPNNTTVYDVIDRANACYNVFTGDSPCQDTANFVKGVKTIKFWTRGARIPAGEQLRPYITKTTPTPTEIKPDKGLAARSHTTVDLIDEPARDDLDKYIEDRAAPAGGTFWPRVLARNPNAIGRFARLRKGYVLEPFDWNAFQTELYVIEAIRGPDRQGEVSFVLSDAVKLLDRTKIPVPTDGKLLADLAATSDAGTARGGTLNTIVLREKASAVDDFYNDQEVHILENTGAGQRLVISDYDGATRTATLSTNWQVIPDTLSVYEIAPLGFTMEDGKGAQYPDPATSGKPEFFRIGDEVIRYSAKASDTLSWADGSYRAQFGTAREQHKKKDGVQLCRAWINVPAATVLEEIINEGGLDDAYIDLVQLATEADDWLKSVANITACISDPETASELFADLLKDVNLMSWWHPVEQKVKFKADMPALASSVPELTDNTLMLRATVAERLDAERITRAAINYDLVSATEDRKRWVNYRTAQIFIDQAAEGPNGYNDVRQDLRQSRWLTEPNELLAKANTHRKVLRYRDTPSKIRVQLDPRDEVQLGDLRDLTTRKLTDAAGNPKTVRCRVVRVVDHGGHFEADLRTTTFNKRYGFIAPAGQANYGAASDAEKVYAYISNGAAMSDGTSAYLIS